MFIFTFIGTVLATGLGALLTILGNKLPKGVFKAIQNFSLGALIGLLFIELIPESFSGFIASTGKEFLSVLYSLLIIVGCGLVFFILHELLHHLSHHHSHDHDDEEDCHDHAHSVDLIKGESLIVESLIFLAAIFVHNIPEGFALGTIFASTSTFPTDGVIMSGVIFLHNLLIGFIMCNSFLNAQKRRRFAIFMTILSSLPAFALAIIGYFVSSVSISELSQGIIFAISAGSLLYVLFIELLPQTFKEYKSKYTFIYAILGFAICVLLIMLGE